MGKIGGPTPSVKVIWRSTGPALTFVQVLENKGERHALTGTPQGVGFARKPPVWLAAGDEVIVEFVISIRIN